MLPPNDHAEIDCELFEIRTTQTSGRGVFAKRAIEKGTRLMHTGPPAFSVIHRPYRREVCAQCYAYDRGRSLPVRDTATGFVFCSEECHRIWNSHTDPIALEAWKILEEFIKRKASQQKKTEESADTADLSSLRAPDCREIADAWAATEANAILIRESRLVSERPSKLQRRAVQSVTTSPTSTSVLSYLLAGVICASKGTAMWSAVICLVDTKSPYPAKLILTEHLDSYLQLLHIVPQPLLPFITAETLTIIASRDAHNAFGLRSLEDHGEELFGHGVWPEASYWNHSCAPNVAKQRVGNTWRFTARRDIASDEQLCITYLGGEEETLNKVERSAKLMQEWGFHCACSRCQSDR